jgi:predicted RecA/RadA family phage recombinase
VALSTNFVNDVSLVNYTNPSSTDTIAAGTPILQGKLFGIASQPILPLRMGALGIRGAWEAPKSTAASTAIAMGADVYWDNTAKLVTATVGTNTLIGKCLRAATDANSTALVYIRP